MIPINLIEKNYQKLTNLQETNYLYYQPEFTTYKMKSIYSLIILLLSLNSISQIKYDYSWAMGYDCCRGDEIDNYILNFNGKKLQIDTATLNVEFFRAGQISDKDGKLALYTNGCKLFNGKNQLVINGDSLIQSDSMPFHCFNFGRQGLILLPDSYDQNLYWFIYKSAFIRNYHKPPGAHLGLYDAFRYSLINTPMNQGRGEVIIKNEAILHDTALLDGSIAVTKHDNNLDWWIISPTDRVDLNYYILLLGKNGIQKIASQKIGNKIANLGDDSDGFLFSPNGNKLARFWHKDGLFLFDFDRKEGVLSNFKKVDFSNSESKIGGLAFSPSGRFLYISTDTILFQYDFLEPDSSKAMIEVGWYDGFSQWYPTNFYTMQLGPDCRIYMATFYTSSYLHVIKYPDQKGVACEFVQHAIQLPFYNSYYMPYFPNFRLGYEPVCDSTINFVTKLSLPNKSIFLNIYPNPTKDLIQFEIELEDQTDVYFIIEDLNAKICSRTLLDINRSQYQINIHDLPSGIYLYKVISDKGMLRNGKLVKT